MSVSNILVFLVGVIIYRLIFGKKAKPFVLLISSIFAIFWLQPATSLRNMDFWFPVLTITLAIFSWIAVTPRKDLFKKPNLICILIILICITVVSLTRFLDSEFWLTATRPPDFLLVMQLLLIFIIILLIEYRLLGEKKLLPILMEFFLLGIFIVIKNPALSDKVDLILRNLLGQSVNLGQGQMIDFRWLGFSYVAFRILHTLRDKQTGRLESVDLMTYLNYIIYFPSFTAGPIDRIEHFINELNTQRNASKDLLQGTKRVIIGLFRKFVIADSLALIALNEQNAVQIKSSLWLWILMFAYSFMIYFDFSGYTDIAIGISKCLGINLPENFDRPYWAPNLTQFWNRWHMTLTQWFRAYFFNPLTRFLRSRQNQLSIPIIIFITQVSTMVVIGLWHGITSNFIIWGLWHGIGLFIHNRWASWIKPFAEKWKRNVLVNQSLLIFSSLATFTFVSIGWIWFVIPNPSIGLSIIGKLFGVH